jgi:hypothetical protein
MVWGKSNTFPAALTVGANTATVRGSIPLIQLSEILGAAAEAVLYKKYPTEQAVVW